MLDWNCCLNQLQTELLRCVHYGVLPQDEAERLHEIVTERKRANRLGISSPPPQKKQKKVKVLKEEGYDDPDVAVSFSGEGVGRVTL
jgi:hypothetical protein